MRLCGLFLVAAFAGVGPRCAAAAPLTCATFRSGLEAALLATRQAPDVPTFKAAFTSPTRGTRYDWFAGSLTGSLSCNPTDVFAEFEIELPFQTRAGMGADLKQLMILQGASLCTLTNGTASACTEYGRKILESAMMQMDAGLQHGVKQPAGVQRRTIAGPLVATATAAPTLITFVIGPMPDQALDDTRPALPTDAASPAAPAASPPDAPPAAPPAP